jgi:hypothetical protein
MTAELSVTLREVYSRISQAAFNAGISVVKHVNLPEALMDAAGPNGPFSGQFVKTKTRRQGEFFINIIGSTKDKKLDGQKDWMELYIKKVPGGWTNKHCASNNYNTNKPCVHDSQKGGKTIIGGNIIGGHVLFKKKLTTKRQAIKVKGTATTYSLTISNLSRVDHYPSNANKEYSIIPICKRHNGRDFAVMRVEYATYESLEMKDYDAPPPKPQQRKK